jgi:hypothetical protein
VRKAAAVSLLVLALVPLPTVIPFAATLPDGLPSMLGWEKITGEADLENPRLRLQYEFYVNPVRPALYELIRYRVTLPDGTAGADDYPAREKLQWQAGQKDLRRFECGPVAEPRSPCRWRELVQGSAEYRREVGVILWLYGVHRRLLLERDAADGSSR